MIEDGDLPYIQTIERVDYRDKLMSLVGNSSFCFGLVVSFTDFIYTKLNEITHNQKKLTMKLKLIVI